MNLKQRKFRKVLINSVNRPTWKKITSRPTSIKMKTIVGPRRSNGSPAAYCEYNARNIKKSNVPFAAFFTVSNFQKKTV